MPKKSAHKASIVQLVERLLAKQKVTSSNLVTRSKKKLDTSSKFGNI